MGKNTDLNVSPYYDDFDESKNFHQIIFRPSVPVQARELTGLQSILQNQIERFGDWAFKNGDIVSGCAISDIPNLPYVRLQDFQTNSASFDIDQLVNVEIVATSSNLQARAISSAVGLENSYPKTNIVYLQYLNTGLSGEQYFSNTDQLTFYKIPRSGNTTLDTIAVVNVYSNASSNTYATGNAHGISVSEGVVFISGCFVRVQNPTIGIVKPYDSYAANSVVGFQAIETIVTENQDSSLNDGALGYDNENAPGAHRLKILPELISLEPEVAANTTGFNPIATYNFGSLLSKTVTGSNVYSIVGEAIAQRVYDQAGNYVVNPFAVDTVTTVSGNSIVASLDANNVLARINPGVGYAQGKRVEIQKTSYINMRRGIDTQVNRQQQITFNYGNYFILNEVSGSFAFNQAETVNLYDAYQKSITNRTFGSLSPTGNIIGTASVRCFSYQDETVGTSRARYALHVFNIKLNGSYNSESIKSVVYNGAIKGVGDVVSNGLVGTSNKDQLYTFGIPGVKNLRDGSNNNNSEYTYRTKASGVMSTNGVVSVILGASAAGGTDILPFGVGTLNAVDSTSFNIIATANVDSSALGGTVSVFNTANNVVGVSTTFTTDFNAGDIIKVGSTIRTITSIANATYLNVDSAFTANAAGQTYYKSYLNGKILPLNQTSTGAYGFVSITNSTAFVISSGQKPSGSLNVDIIYDVLRTGVSPAKKTINKNRFVKIDTSTNPNGPWCLGVSDIHQIRKVYSTSNGAYTTSGSDVTSNFVFDSGQKDTHYDLGYLYAKSSPDKNLLVQLDYFTANTTTGSGFFTVESYPIDDVNTSNTTAIQTKDIPLYVDEAGIKTVLRDYIDFRTVCVPTANNTGSINTANSAQVSSAITAATLNPSSTLSFSIPAAGLNVPSYGGNFQADFTNYLPRKDLILITPDNMIKAKEGVSSLSPQTPLYPDNAMVVAVLNVPAYPSLSSDQADSLLTFNKSSKNLIRDTSSAISCNIVTNRRYTMRDIGVLDKRITNIEYFTQLSLLEKKASELTVTDANGLDRFKNGIFVDPFSDFLLSEVSNPEYSIAIDSSKGIGRPRIIREIVRIEFNSGASSNVVRTGRLISLPYDETIFLNQPFATKFRSAAPVAYSWSGSVILIPSYDNHNDTINTGSINITVDNAKPWREFAQGPFGSVWGDWRTTSTSTSSSVLDGTLDQTTLNVGGANWVVITEDNVWDFIPGGRTGQWAGYTIGNIHGY